MEQPQWGNNLTNYVLGTSGLFWIKDWIAARERVVTEKNGNPYVQINSCPPGSN